MLKVLLDCRYFPKSLCNSRDDHCEVKKRFTSVGLSGIPGRQALRSSVTGQLLLEPRAKTATRQRRAFSIVGPFSWNGLPLEIRLLPKNNESAFCRSLKTYQYRRDWTGGASE